eukprot:2540134-Rhodomonas_salina.1
MYVEVGDGSTVGEDVVEGDRVGVEPAECGGDEGEEGEGMGLVVVVVDPILVVDSILERQGLGIAPLLPALAFPDERVGQGYVTHDVGVVIVST